MGSLGTVPEEAHGLPRRWHSPAVAPARRSGGQRSSPPCQGRGREDLGEATKSKRDATTSRIAHVEMKLRSKRPAVLGLQKRASHFGHGKTEGMLWLACICSRKEWEQWTQRSPAPIPYGSKDTYVQISGPKTIVFWATWSLSWATLSLTWATLSLSWATWSLTWATLSLSWATWSLTWATLSLSWATWSLTWATLSLG